MKSRYLSQCFVCQRRNWLGEVAEKPKKLNKSVAYHRGCYDIFGSSKKGMDEWIWVVDLRNCREVC